MSTMQQSTKMILIDADSLQGALEQVERAQEQSTQGDGSYLLVLCNLLPADMRTLIKETQMPVCHAQSMYNSSQVVIAGPSSYIDHAVSFMSSRQTGNTVEVYILGEKAEYTSVFKLVENQLRCVHTFTAAEAMSLCKRAGLSAWTCYDVLCGAAGGSWSYRNRVPEMLGESFQSGNETVEEAHTHLSSYCKEARVNDFPQQMTTLCRQLLLHISALGDGGDSVSSISKLWGTIKEQRAPATKTEDFIRSEIGNATFAGKVGFIGLGAMGSGMASVLHKANFDVTGFDVYQPAMDLFSRGGGKVAKDLQSVSYQADILILVVVNAAQAESILVDQGIVKGLATDAVVIIMSTVAPSAAVALTAKIHAVRPDVHYLDAPISGGAVRAGKGDLTIPVAGADVAISKAMPVLKAMSGTLGNYSNLIIIPGGVGKAAVVKLVNQVLAGTHVLTTVEALAFLARSGLPLRRTHELLLKSSGASFILGDRGLNALDGLVQPAKSAISIWTKDMGLVVDEADVLGMPTFLSACAQQYFVEGASRGWGKDDDSSLGRLWNSEGIAPK